MMQLLGTFLSYSKKMCEFVMLCYVWWSDGGADAAVDDDDDDEAKTKKPLKEDCEL